MKKSKIIKVNNYDQLDETLILFFELQVNDILIKFENDDVYYNLFNYLFKYNKPVHIIFFKHRIIRLINYSFSDDIQCNC